MDAAQEIPLDEIFVSPTNPRRHYDEKKLADLADSVGKLGVLQPVLVRPSGKNAPAPWELIFGTRRFKAAHLAKLETIPIRVVEMTDDEVLDAQAVENGQREDVHPLEEAELYELMLKPPTGANYAPRTVDQIAAKVAKSKAWVYSRLKLLDLTEANRKRFYDGGLDASTALLLARIPNAELQDRAGKEITEGRWEGSDPMSYREAQHHVRARYMLRLAEAPFDIKDAELVPGAGACGSCPKRTGNQAELFADVDSAAVCTDPACFTEKKRAHADRLVAEARAKKLQVLPAADVKKAFDKPAWDGGGYGLRWDADLRKADDKTPDEKVILAKTPDGELHRLVRREQPKTKASSSKPREPKVDLEDLAIARASARSMDELIEAFSTRPTPAAWRAALAAYAEVQSYELEPVLARRTLGPDKVTGRYGEFKGDQKKAIAAILAKAKTIAELAAIAVDFLLAFILQEDGIEELEPVLKLAGVDYKAHLKRATEELQPAKPAKPAKGRSCRSCGCTETKACKGGCKWVVGADGLPTGICTRCSPAKKPTKPAATKKAAKK
jgi:ParB/RepB/Spo0J family partition protein